MNLFIVEALLNIGLVKLKYDLLLELDLLALHIFDVRPCMRQLGIARVVELGRSASGRHDWVHDLA